MQIDKVRPNGGAATVKWLTMHAACARWGCGKTTLYALTAAGSLDARKLGRRTLWSVDVGDAFFASLPSMRGEPS